MRPMKLGISVDDVDVSVIVYPGETLRSIAMDMIDSGVAGNVTIDHQEQVLKEVGYVESNGAVLLYCDNS